MYGLDRPLFLLWFINMPIIMTRTQLYKKSDCLAGRTVLGSMESESLTHCGVYCQTLKGEGFSYDSHNKTCQIFKETFGNTPPCVEPGIFGKIDVCHTPPSLGSYSGNYTVEHPYMGDNSMARYKCTRYDDPEPVNSCPVSRCGQQWTPPSLSCSKKDIFDSTSANYEGKVTCTDKGVTCQRWDSNTPHEPVHFVSRSDLHNWCQHLNKSRPWCYTTDPNQVWDYCPVEEVASCPNPPPMTDPDADIITEWPYNNNNLIARYKCSKRVLLNAMPGPSCPVSVCRLSDRTWSTSVVACSECYDHNMNMYDGFVTCTEKGIPCQRWDSNSPHVPSQFSGRSDLDNRCMLDITKAKPWCYTTDPDTEWDYCPVVSCADLPP